MKKNQNTVRVSDSLDLLGQTLARTVCRQKMTERILTEIPGIAHERHILIKSGDPGPLTIAVLLLTTPPPPLAIKVIWRWNHSFKSHTMKWWRKGKFWLFYYYICVWGGPVTSFTFRNSRGVQHIVSRGGGGGGVKLFIKGVEFQLAER